VGVLIIESLPDKSFKTTIPIMVLVFVEVVKPHLIDDDPHHKARRVCVCLL
jgi:hypothetical protein